MPRQWLADFGAFLDEYLDERAFLVGVFPRRGALAAGEADDDVADAPGLAGLHHQILNDVVALVEQAERGDAVFDRRSEFAFGHFLRNRRSRGDGQRHVGSGRFGGLVRSAVAPRQRQSTQRDQSSGAAHRLRRPATGKYYPHPATRLHNPR